MEPLWIERLITLAIGFAAGVLVTALAWIGQRRWSRRVVRVGDTDLEGVELFEDIERGAPAAAREMRPPPIEEIYIRRLGEDEVRDFRARWVAIQRVFVDEPARALDLGHDLLDELIGTLGYPSRPLDEQIELLAVHHWDSIPDYRAAHELYEARREGKATTEDLRQALLHYRELFADLLDTDRRDAQGRVRPEGHAFH